MNRNRPSLPDHVALVLLFAVLSAGTVALIVWVIESGWPG